LKLALWPKILYILGKVPWAAEECELCLSCGILHRCLLGQFLSCNLTQNYVDFYFGLDDLSIEESWVLKEQIVTA
jgi:hypothetical protein